VPGSRGQTSGAQVLRVAGLSSREREEIRQQRVARESTKLAKSLDPHDAFCPMCGMFYACLSG
jgi:hypothetical protein